MGYHSEEANITSEKHRNNIYLFVQITIGTATICSSLLPLLLLLLFPFLGCGCSLQIFPILFHVELFKQISSSLVCFSSFVVFGGTDDLLAELAFWEKIVVDGSRDDA